MKGPRATKLKFGNPRIHTQTLEKAFNVPSGPRSEGVILMKPRNPSWSQVSRREAWREPKEALKELDKLRDLSLMNSVS